MRLSRQQKKEGPLLLLMYQIKDALRNQIKALCVSALKRGTAQTSLPRPCKQKDEGGEGRERVRHLHW